ncbi:unnamed protein product [Rhizophagus irregularis]|nr:unnamed protein product [Rhizophagus irregularis]
MIDEAGSDCELVDLEVPEITETEKEMENQRLAIRCLAFNRRQCKRRKLKALSQNSSWEIKPTYLDINLRNIRVRLINDIEY